MLRAILIDDEQIALDVLEILLLENGTVDVVGKFQLVSEAIEQVEGLRPDLIFLDIEMPGMSGLTAGEVLLQRCPDAEIIFVTAYHQYAIEAFEINAIDYLLKPVSKERLEKTLLRYTELQNKFSRRTDLDNSSVIDESAEEPKDQGCLTLKVFGSMELYGTDGQPVAWRTRKTKELFAYLWSFGGEPAYRYHIFDHLWPDLNVERGQALFHTSLYNLRNMLKMAGFPDMVAFGNERYWMRTETIQSDAARFNSLLDEEARLDTVEELLALYRGDYLETEHYQWADSHRAQLRGAYIRRLDQLAAIAEGVQKELLLWKLIELDPYRKQDIDRLSQLLHETGKIAEAKRLADLKAKIEAEIG